MPVVVATPTQTIRFSEIVRVRSFSKDMPSNAKDCSGMEKLKRDGKSHMARMIHILLYKYFESQCISSSNDVATVIKDRFGDLGSKKIREVSRECINEIDKVRDRVMKSDNDNKTSPIPTTSGDKGFTVTKLHCPHLRVLANMIKQAIDEHFSGDF